jgi:hypothetical protein
LNNILRRFSPTGFKRQLKNTNGEFTYERRIN